MHAIPSSRMDNQGDHRILSTSSPCPGNDFNGMLHFVLSDLLRLSCSFSLVNMVLHMGSLAKPSGMSLEFV